MTYVYNGRKRDLGIDLIAANRAILKARPAGPVLDVCGTQDGWLRHRWRHERPCTPCQDAHGTPARRRRTRKAAA